MARQNSALENNSFAKGIITEASPLNFPEGASLDERNFVIERDGSRRRRLGMDFEAGGSPFTSPDIATIGGEFVSTTYRWSDAGQLAVDIIVVQAGRVILFYDSSSVPLSDGLLNSFTLDTPNDLGTPYEFSYANASGLLVVVSGKSQIDVFEYKNGTVVKTEDRLAVRDIWGVKAVWELITDIDPDAENDLRAPINISRRPTDKIDEHIYNLRNQTWAMPRKPKDGNTPTDPINSFVVAEGTADPVDGGSYPSNSDSVILGLYPNPEDTEDPVGNRFWEATVRTNTYGSSEAPRGFFIIDLLNRSQSRLEEFNSLMSNKYGFFSAAADISGLPEDYTKGGASCVGNFAGRIWYSGFNGENIGGDKYTPSLSSYVAFSRLVTSKDDVSKCYQEGDPTSLDTADIVDTDGGILQISGARNIQKLVDLGTSLIVMASNGIWAVSGGSDYGFSATNYRVSKISENGIIAQGSAVSIGSEVVYWSHDGIYSISGNAIEGFSAQNITESTVQGLFNDIGSLEKAYARGFFDRFERKIRWIYNCREASTGPVKELVFDTLLGAFYLNDINRTDTGYPLVVGMVEVPPFVAGESVDNVVVNGGQVLVNGEDVTITSTVRSAAIRSTKYVSITRLNQYGVQFAEYRDPSFLDWESYTLADSVDAEAYLVTGYAPGVQTTEGGARSSPDRQRYKQVPYLTMHFIRTEDGFEDVAGDLVPTNQSSCLVQARWEWANSANSNRWGRQFQAYRYKRLYMPADVNDPYDTGFETLITKNKIRGKGRVVSFKMETEPGKDCRILGWSMIMGSNGNV